MSLRMVLLRPPPPGDSKHNDVRYLHIHEGDVIDERQFTRWIKHASKLPGERKSLTYHPVR